MTRATPDPVGGVIVRDAAGEPTGIFKDAAQDLIAKVIPPPTEAEMTEALRAALAEAARVGLTSVHSITVDADSWNGSFTGEIQLLRRAELEGWLTCRMYEIIPITRWEKLRDAGLAHNMGDDFIKLGAVKAFADGSLGSATAWMYEPFADDPANRGIPLPLMNPPAKMEALASGADQAQIQLCIHAIGDRAIAEILDMYERLGGANAAAHRFRIEHAQHMRPQDFARFGKLGIIASMQPYHAIDDGRWAEKRLGHERAKWSYAWRSMLDAGAPVGVRLRLAGGAAQPHPGHLRRGHPRHAGRQTPGRMVPRAAPHRGRSFARLHAGFRLRRLPGKREREHRAGKTRRRRGALRRPLHHPPRQNQRCARGHDHRGGKIVYSLPRGQGMPNRIIEIHDSTLEKVTFNGPDATQQVSVLHPPI